MPEQTRAQFHINTRSRMCKQIRPQTAQHNLKQRHHQQSHRHHIQSRESPMYQHLVHHHLEKQRCNQCKQLQHHRHHQYLKKQPAVFDYRRNKPGKVKLSQTAQYRSTGSNQYQFARISVRKFGKRQYRRLIRNQILYQKLGMLTLPVCFGQNEMVAVITPYQCR